MSDPSRRWLQQSLVLAILVAACGGSVAPAATPAPTVAAPSPAPVSSGVALSSAQPSPSPSRSPAARSPTPPPSPSPVATGTGAWFEDGFDAALGWQPADPRLLSGAVESGEYVLRPHPSTEPAYAWAPRDGAIGAATIEASITFPAPGRSLAGLAVADLDFGLRLVLLLGAAGDWRLQRDDAAELRTLASGRIPGLDAGTRVVLRLVIDDGSVTAWAGSQQLARATMTIDVGHVGLAAQAPIDGERILVDDYRVIVPRLQSLP